MWKPPRAFAKVDMVFAVHPKSPTLCLRGVPSRASLGPRLRNRTPRSLPNFYPSILCLASITWNYQGKFLVLPDAADGPNSLYEGHPNPPTPLQLALLILCQVHSLQIWKRCLYYASRWPAATAWPSTNVHFASANWLRPQDTYGCYAPYYERKQKK